MVPVVPDGAATDGAVATCKGAGAGAGAGGAGAGAGAGALATARGCGAEGRATTLALAEAGVTPGGTYALGVCTRS
jgi:hypothetical protein